jgi:hypothetical protein
MSLQKLSPGNIQMKKYLDGSIFSKGVPFVLRAFNKKLDPKTKCKLQVNVFSTGNDYGTTACQITFDSTSRSWRYSWSRFVVESDVSSGEVLLDCEVVDVGKELYWAGIGFFVEPEFACQCPKGYYFQIQPLRTGEGECIRCPAGYYCAGSMIRRCPLGMFSFGKAEKCEVCRNGWICVDGLASLCNPGTYTSENSTCLPCPEGYSCRNGKKWVSLCNLSSRV